MRAEEYFDIAVPFTDEEIDELTAQAEARGGSLVDLIRERVFAPANSNAEGLAPDSESLTAENLTAMFARVEGVRIRARGRRRD